ncbi:hypothetical protein FACS1894122_04820 [Alphaproteobacteria bacterium]|nr:hypothetical protein FACS1894122_04820 [Alphaproteobacteria bacterium]
MARYSYGYWGLVVVLLSACERSSMSPVEIKINDDSVISPAGDTLSSSKHRVRAGETLFDIAYRYNVDPMNLAKTNGIKAPYRVREGQLLQLPKTDDQTPYETEDNVVVTEDGNVDGSHEENEENVEHTENAGKTDEAESTEDEKTKERDRLDEELESVINSKLPASSSPKQTADTLSKPKIVENASGTPKKEAPASDGKLIWPVEGKIISEFGDIKDGVPNDGIYIKAAPGTPVKAADAGEVICARDQEEYGNLILIKHSSGLVTSYAHLRDMKVKVGDTVKAGDEIGSVGKTGDVSEPQLYFEVMKNKNSVNPKKFLK